MTPEPLEFVAPRRWDRLGLAGSLLFVLLGAFLALKPGLDASARPVGWANVGFFGLCALVYARSGATGPRLRLDAAGIHHRHPRSAAAFSFAWPHVAGVRVRHEERASLVVLTLRGPEGLPADAAPDWALAKGAWPEWIPAETTLSPAALGVPPETLAEEIERFRRIYGASQAG